MNLLLRFEGRKAEKKNMQIPFLGAFIFSTHTRNYSTCHGFRVKWVRRECLCPEFECEKYGEDLVKYGLFNEIIKVKCAGVRYAKKNLLTRPAKSANYIARKKNGSEIALSQTVTARHVTNERRPFNKKKTVAPQIDPLSFHLNIINIIISI